MTTGWKKLTRRDLVNFDKFATDAVLTAMELGGVGRIGTNGHARIRGNDRASITISRDSSAPHCQGNVLADLKRAFPELRTNGTTKEEATDIMTATKTNDSAIQEMLECPARGCEEKFSSVHRLGTHIKDEHFVCKREGCNLGPSGGPYIGRTKQAIAGHVNIQHEGNQPWLQNKEKAAAGRAATVAAKRKAREAGLVNAEANRAAITAAKEEAESAPEVEPVETPAPTLAVYPTKSSMGVIMPAVANGNDSDAEAKLALIQEILGENPEVAKLKKELADVKAHLALVREAVGLDFGDDES